jgi:hypothetical protein
MTELTALEIGIKPWIGGNPVEFFALIDCLKSLARGDLFHSCPVPDIMPTTFESKPY